MQQDPAGRQPGERGSPRSAGDPGGRGAGRPIPASGTLAGRSGAWTARCARTAEPQHLRYEQIYRGSRQRLRQYPARRSSAASARGSCSPARACAHERTLFAPKEDRYKLLRDGGQHEPDRGLFADPDGSRSSGSHLAANPADADVTDDDGSAIVCGPCPRTVLGASRDDPLSTPRRAPGHDRRRHTTATRLRWQYRDQRRANGPARPILPRVRDDAFPRNDRPGADGPADAPSRAAGLATKASRPLDHAERLFDVRPIAERSELEAAFASVDTVPGREGRFGCGRAETAGLLDARRDAFAKSMRQGGAALRRLDVALLQVALDRLCGIGRRRDRRRTAGLQQVRGGGARLGRRGARWRDAAFLLDPTP